MSQTSFCATWPQSHGAWGRIPHSKLKLEPAAVDGVPVLRCQGRITYREEAAQFSRRVAELLPQTKQLVVDLSEIEVIDCAGLGELVLVELWSQASGCSIKLAAPRRNVLEVLRLTNLVSVLEIHPTLGEALLAYRPRLN
jgi:anti-anti-sigma factor